ncbi:endogenous retrovirus group K member 113 Gag polyprotein-like [Camarhynchus parvulus]|uniref:endogenous retrovirus group K member 113 Gag polyprotein-like n=1 Tax=Geospiza parvula TaxID=87175 RepID=UPI0012382152|nr:endogenous retrovirus group K member 113 Gag polyprotein-like [Camarhynchus parvulus]
MGARLSTSQRESVHLCFAFLYGADLPFKEREIKSLIRWVSSQFKNFSPEQCKDLRFWEEVLRKLSNLARSEEIDITKRLKLAQHLHWVAQLVAALKIKQTKERGGHSAAAGAPVARQRSIKRRASVKSSVESLVVPPVSVPSSAPTPQPSPATPKSTGILRRAAPNHRRPPDPSEGPSQASQSPHCRRSSAGSLAASPCPSPSPNPRFQVLKSPKLNSKVRFVVPPQDGSCGAQDGGDHEAPWRDSLSHFPSGRPSPNPFLPLPNPFLPEDPPTYTSSPWSTPPVAPPSAPPVAPPAAPPYHLAPPPSSVTSQLLPPGSGSHASTSVSHDPPSWPDLGAGGGSVGNSEPDVPDSITAAPVTFHLRQGGRWDIRWTPVSRAVIRELCKTQKEFGSASEYFKGLLNATLRENELVPCDVRQIFSCLLNESQFSRWEEGWRQAVADLLPEILAQPNISRDANGNLLTVEHLCGLGDWEKGQQAAELIPSEALEKSTQAGAQEFFKVLVGVPQTPVFLLQQGPEESFDDFVMRLQAAARFENVSEGTRQEMVAAIAASNANAACKAAILSLPLQPAPTLKQMLLVCARKVPALRQTTAVKTPSAGKRVSVAEGPEVFMYNPEDPIEVAASQGPGTPRQQRGHCHLCSKEGHWMPDCPLRKAFYQFRREHESGGSTKGAPSSSQKN